MTNLEKLRILLPHWITHNKEHNAEFARWVELCKDSENYDVAKALEKAMDTTENVTKELERALELAGGPIEHPEHHHHHHHHHEHGTN